MCCSTLRKVSAPTAVVAICGVLLASIPAFAQESRAPEGVIRTFAVLSDPADTPPDFLSDESLGVVVMAPDRNFDSFQFSDFEPDPRFASTAWLIQSALHMTREGARIPGSVYWLQTPETPNTPPAATP